MGQWDYTAVAPTPTNPAALANTAPASTNPAALSGAAPVASAPAALSGAAPTAVVPAALSVVAPGHTDPAALSAAAPVAAGVAALSAVAPTVVAPAALSGAAPAHSDPAALSGVAPVASAPAALSGAAPTAVVPAAVTAAAPAHSHPTGYTAEPPRLNPAFPLTPAPTTDNNVNTPTIILQGELTLNQVYGQTRIPANCVLTRVQVALQDPPIGGPATLRLVDGAGAAYLSAGNPIEVTVLDGQTFGETVLGAQTALPAGANVLAKATVVGVGTPGGFGAVTLFTQLGS